MTELTSDFFALLESDPFYGTSGLRSAEILLVGESWGSEEALKKQPFVGPTGREFDRILTEAGINRVQCFITNVIPAQPPANQLSAWFDGEETFFGCKPNRFVIQGVKNLITQVQTIKPRVIVALGNFAFWALCAEAPLRKLPKAEGGHLVPYAITDWRGSMLYTRVNYGDPVPVVPTLHPAVILRQWSWRPYIVHDLKTRVPLAPHNWKGHLSEKVVEPTYEQVLDFLRSTLDRAAAGPFDLVVDIETKNRNITCIGFATSAASGFVLPLVRPDPKYGLDSYWTAEQELVFMPLLRKVFLHPNIRLVGQNFLYDMQYLNVWLALGRRIRCHFDTMCAYHVLFPGTEKSLDVLSSLFCDHHIFWKHESQEWEKDIDNLRQLLDYNATDVLRTYEIFSKVSALVESSGMTAQWSYMRAAINSAFQTMCRGLRRDWREIERLRVWVAAETEKRTRWLESICPDGLFPLTVTGKAAKWYFSTSQQQALFYNWFKLPTVVDRKTDRPTMNDEALVVLRRRAPYLGRILTTLQELRSLRLYSSLYLEAYSDPDGRIRATLNPAGTETFRYSSSKNAFHRGLNLQNITSGDE